MICLVRRNALSSRDDSLTCNRLLRSFGRRAAFRFV
jgi:hypothetical protein